jgi:hypothetical protein
VTPVEAKNAAVAIAVPPARITQPGTSLVITITPQPCSTSKAR